MEVKLLSYNTSGFNEPKGKFIHFLSICLDLDIIIVQEHLHLKENLSIVEKELSNFNSFILPAIKQNKFISSGRPSGGLGIFLEKILKLLY